MSEPPPTQLSSEFLFRLRTAFLAAKFGDDLELREELSSTVLRESLEVCLYLSRHGLYVYQTLTVWGDQVAVFSVRENTTKRRHKLLFRLEEFPLVLTPEQVVELFRQSSERVVRLDFPPGDSNADRDLFAEIGALWQAATTDPLH